MGGLQVRDEHEITLSGNQICRDGYVVKIIGYTKTRDLRVGCTRITRAALLKLVELSTNSDVGDEKILQAGQA